MTRARRGDLVVWLERTTTFVQGVGTREHERWRVGMCAKAKRSGLCEAIATSGHQFDHGYGTGPEIAHKAWPITPAQRDTALELIEYANRLDLIGYYLPDVAAARESLAGMLALIEARLPGVLKEADTEGVG